MAKAILEFDLNEPDDARAHLRCAKALDMALAISGILKIEREINKYNKNKIHALAEIFAIAGQINIDELI